MGLSNDRLEQLRAYPVVNFFKTPAKGRVQHFRCPFHSEKSPSFALYKDNSWHCFGCGAHGRGAIDFLVKLGGGTKDAFKEAVEELERRVP